MMPGGKQDPALPPAPRAARLTVTAKPVLQNNATGAGDSRNQALSNFDDQEGKRKAGGGGNDTRRHRGGSKRKFAPNWKYFYILLDINL